jgi:hypothetical protein
MTLLTFVALFFNLFYRGFLGDFFWVTFLGAKKWATFEEVEVTWENLDF